MPKTVRVPRSADEGVSLGAACTLPTAWGTFQLRVFTEADSHKEHLALIMGSPPVPGSTLVRIHSECLTGDTLFSERCDCGTQLRESLQAIRAEGCGVLLYLRQEGRGIGLAGKIRAYALQETGLDTVAANVALGFGADERGYAMCGAVLRQLGICDVRLMTNNPQKIEALLESGLTVARIPIASTPTPTMAATWKPSAANWVTWRRVDVS